MRRDTPSRRRFLSRTVAVASALGLAGCLSDGSSGDDGAPATTTDGTASSAETDEATTTNPEDVAFEAPHEATIEATAYGTGDCGVVLVPQINRDRGSWEPQAEVLAGGGHLALAIDEDSDNRSASVRGAIQYLRERRNVSTVVLVGASTGGEAVVVANAETDATVDGTVALSAAGGTDHASDLQGRSLFVVATGDGDRFVSTARDLRREAPEPKTLVEYEGAAHGQGIFESEHGDDLQDRMRTFVSEVCGS